MSLSSAPRLGAAPKASGKLRCLTAWDEHGLQVRKRDSRVSIITPYNREGQTLCGENGVRRRDSGLRRTKSLSDALNRSRPDDAVAKILFYPFSDEVRVRIGSGWRDPMEPVLIPIVCATQEGE